LADNEENERVRPEPIDVTPLATEAQIDLAKQLQAGLLRTYLVRIKQGTISGTELANVQRLLHANGWSLDPKQIPQELKDMLTSHVDPNELDEDVLPIRRKA
jgi:hypothetical protein